MNSDEENRRAKGPECGRIGVMHHRPPPVRGRALAMGDASRGRFGDANLMFLFLILAFGIRDDLILETRLTFVVTGLRVEATNTGVRFNVVTFA